MGVGEKEILHHAVAADYDAVTEKRVIISLVTWNSEHHLEALFESLAAQTETHAELLITDNASADRSVAIISDWIPRLPFPVTLTRSQTNTGFARAHNAHIRAAIERRAPYIVLVNPDMVLDAHAISEMASVLDVHAEAASVGGKIFQLRFVEGPEGMRAEKTDKIDSTGIAIARTRKSYERGHDARGYREATLEPILGVSGAFVMYRTRALVEVGIPKFMHRHADDPTHPPLEKGEEKIEKEYFDEDFFIYKEDVDLAWRLQLFGWSSYFSPLVIAWHHRTMREGRRRTAVPAPLRALSWRNHFFVSMKNDDRANLIRDFPLIFSRECGKIIWILIREPKTLATLPSLVRLWNAMLKKRRWIMKNRVRTPKEMRRILFARLSSSITEPRGY